MHPKPEEETPPAAPGSRRSSKDVGADVPVDANLIQLDAYVFFFFVSIHFYNLNVVRKKRERCCRSPSLSFAVFEL
jgi:hypothetical protein